MLTRDQILSADDCVVEPISLPDWRPDGTPYNAEDPDAYIRVISGADRDKFEESLVRIRGNDRQVNLRNYSARFSALVLCDAEGKPIFSDTDIQKLTKKSSRMLNKVVTEASRLNGISESDIQEMVGGLKNDPNGDSGSD